MLLERFERQLNKKRDNTKITFITAIKQMYEYFNIVDDEKQVKTITAFQLEDYIEELKKDYKTVCNLLNSYKNECEILAYLEYDIKITR